MKLQNKLYAIVVIIAMLLATLAGCAESRNNDIITHQQADEVQPDMSDKETDSVLSACISPLMIENVDDYRSELLRHFEASRTVGEEDENYSLYLLNEIADIKEFYFPTMEIDGYELYAVEAGQGGMRYYYALTEMLKNSDDLLFVPVIEITILFPKAISGVDFEHPFESWIEIAREEGKSLTEDNMLYRDFEGYAEYGGHGIITAPIGDMVFSISVPSYPTNDAFVRVDEYEVSRELALRFIETAELITVG